MTQAQFMPILFKVLFGFVLLNMLVNFLLLWVHKKRMYKLLALFWPAVLLTFILQGMSQEDPFLIALAYSFTLVPMTIFAKIGLEVTGRKLPWKGLAAIYSLSFPCMLFLYQAGTSFTAYSMPFALATAAPLVYTWWHLLVVDRRQTTRLQKVLGAVMFIMPFHCINFSLFRMDEPTQLWGWLVSYALYDTLAILLPSIALEEAKLHENEKLQKLVEERTLKLRQSLKDNEGLLKVLLHDISNPLMVMKYYSEKDTSETFSEEDRLKKMVKSQDAIEMIISQVKQQYLVQKGQYPLPLKPVALEECFNEVSFIFAQSMEKKRVSLKFHSQLSPSTMVLADKSSLTHSVLSNLVSNGLKFSSPDSEIEITAREQSNSVILEVRDKGPGIPQDVIDRLMNDSEVISTEGTLGETGTGFGLSIVKSFVQSYGGEIEFESSHLPGYQQVQGTNIRISLDRA